LTSIYTKINTEKAEGGGLPQYHIRVRLKTVLPRILPATDYELTDFRNKLDTDLDALLAVDPSQIIVDNAPPLYFGFSLGFYLIFHGGNNQALKSKLFRVYAKLCPALLQVLFYYFSL
jgi:hypothetical protein